MIFFFRLMCKRGENKDVLGNSVLVGTLLVNCGLPLSA